MSNRIRPNLDLRAGAPWSRKCTKTKHHSGRYGGRHTRRRSRIRVFDVRHFPVDEVLRAKERFLEAATRTGRGA